MLWGICLRVVLSLIGHWLIGYFAHNGGDRDYHLNDHAVQGYNLPQISLITMGESLHNNHHAYPNSAKLSIARGQLDPGWWAITAFKKLNWAWDIQLPENQDHRPELQRIKKGTA